MSTQLREDKPKKKTSEAILMTLEHMNENLSRISRNQFFGAMIFGLIVLVVLIQGQRITIKIPGVLEVSSAETNDSK